MQARKIVFVDNLLYEKYGRSISITTTPHMGLMSLASVLEQSGHSVHIFDPKRLFASRQYSRPSAAFISESVASIAEYHADVVGFTAYGISFDYAQSVATAFKEQFPDIPVLLGGPHATVLAEQIAQNFECFDIIVRHEAEPFITELIEALYCGAIEHVPSITMRKGGRVVSTPPLNEPPSMDLVPLPALHLYPIKEDGLAELSLEAGRGCPFPCTFCSTSGFFKKRYRLKSNNKLIAEMIMVRNSYGVKRFNLNHDLFGLVRESVLEFCDLIEPHKFRWKCSLRPDTVDEYLLNRMILAGCEHVYYGVETGSKKLQGVIKKRLDLEKVRRIIEATVSRGISCTVSFITGFPDETIDDQYHTLDFIGNLLSLDHRHIAAQLHILSPEPGSRMFEGDNDLDFDGKGPLASFILNDELVRGNRDIFSVFRFYRSTIPRKQVLVAAAFVQYVLPSMGPALTVHICRQLFDGRLSQFVAAVSDSIDRPATDDWTVFCEQLLDVVQVVIQDVRLEGSGYMSDLIQLSRDICTLMMPADCSRPPLSREFRFDVLELAKYIMDNPIGALPFSVRHPSRTSCLIDVNRFGIPRISKVAAS